MPQSQDCSRIEIQFDSVIDGYRIIIHVMKMYGLPFIVLTEWNLANLSAMMPFAVMFFYLYGLVFKPLARLNKPK
tara:strand:+ start:761 stop:985 length:225 start_codon:yes stop_codon:yes gene_type:complete